MRNIKNDLRKTIFVDLDGTLVKHNYNPDEIIDELLDGTLNYLLDNKQECLILTTSRKFRQLSEVLERLKSCGIYFSFIIADLPTGIRILINDSKTDEQKAIAINLVRDVGYGN